MFRMYFPPTRVLLNYPSSFPRCCDVTTFFDFFCKYWCPYHPSVIKATVTFALWCREVVFFCFSDTLSCPLPFTPYFPPIAVGGWLRHSGHFSGPQRDSFTCLSNVPATMLTAHPCGIRLRCCCNLIILRDSPFLF